MMKNQDIDNQIAILRDLIFTATYMLQKSQEENNSNLGSVCVKKLFLASKLLMTKASKDSQLKLIRELLERDDASLIYSFGCTMYGAWLTKAKNQYSGNNTHSTDDQIVRGIRIGSDLTLYAELLNKKNGITSSSSERLSEERQRELHRIESQLSERRNGILAHLDENIDLINWRHAFSTYMLSFQEQPKGSMLPYFIP